MVAVDDRKKNTKVLSLNDRIDILEMMKEIDLEEIAKSYSVTVRSLRYLRRKYNAFNETNIECAIQSLRREVRQISSHTYRDYDKQHRCEQEKGHVTSNFTMFFKCGCTLILGEKDFDQIYGIMTRIKENRDRNQQKPKEVFL